MQDKPGSESENHGLAVLTDSDLQVYSVGISTGGSAEIRMAQSNPQRHIVATTVDQDGINSADEWIKKEHLEDRIETKIEDVAQPLPYTDNYFDFVYARLVLHYLAKADLEHALAELFRVTKPGGKLFVVVRSTECPDAKRPDATYDPETCMTTVIHADRGGKQRTSSRYYHTPESISGHVTDAGFTVDYTKDFEERLSIDFGRAQMSEHTDNVIELLAHK